MSKQIDKLEFWKERIDKATKQHYSVYVASDGLWKRINDAHEKIIKEIITDNDFVLDAGCGYGRLSQHFLPRQYQGVDFSPDFISLARRLYPDYRFKQANLKDLPFFDKEFDWAICVSIKKMVIDNLGDKEWEAIRNELQRVSKHILLLEYETEKNYEIM